ncbi:MAG: hypothetical protein A3C53_06655 [Omnitrophica WOR_2 bacterium RIFCSPHIGHO2_02_FULL_68_15]|nr:MAG: hypothetical protein A3C53_06655 [Omnitrophica WOR_2 bacterium RIFCSPHIGHO2_02_FULL_68_15]
MAAAVVRTRAALAGLEELTRVQLDRQLRSWAMAAAVSRQDIREKRSTFVILAPSAAKAMQAALQRSVIAATLPPSMIVWTDDTVLADSLRERSVTVVTRPADIPGRLAGRQHPGAQALATVYADHEEWPQVQAAIPAQTSVTLQQVASPLDLAQFVTDIARTVGDVAAVDAETAAIAAAVARALTRHYQ